MRISRIGSHSQSVIAMSKSAAGFRWRFSVVLFVPTPLCDYDIEARLKAAIESLIVSTFSWTSVKIAHGKDTLLLLHLKAQKNPVPHTTSATTQTKPGCARCPHPLGARIHRLPVILHTVSSRRHYAARLSALRTYKLLGWQKE